MLKVQVNKKMVQHYIMEKTGKKVGLEDLHNIQTDRKKKMVTRAKSEIEQVYDIVQVVMRQLLNMLLNTITCLQYFSRTSR
jgi:hypothetical protein